MIGFSKKSLVLFCLIALLVPTKALASEVIGSVISISGTASILRDGKLKQVYLRDTIRAGDSLITSANKATMRVWLYDDTSILLAPDTDFTISTYIDDKKRSKIITKLNNGAVKIYSGDIVRRYPNAFTLSTEDGLITLKQGIASVKKTSSVTSVYVENTPNEDVVFNDKSIPSGYKANVTTRHLIPDVTLISLFDREVLAADFDTLSYKEIATRKYREANSSNYFMNYQDSKQPEYDRIDENHKLRVFDNYYYTAARGKNNSLEDMQSYEIVALLANDYYDSELLEFELPNIYTAPIAAPVAIANVRMGAIGALSNGTTLISNSSFDFALNIFDGAITDANLYNGTISASGGSGQWAHDNDYDGRDNIGLGSFQINNYDKSNVNMSGTLESKDQSFTITDGIYNVGSGNLTIQNQTELTPNF